MTLSRAVMIVVAGLVLAVSVPAEDAVSKDKEKLIGTWKVVSLEVNGQKFPPEATKDFRFVFTAESATRKLGDKAESGAGYRLDPSRSPKWIDMTGKKDGKDHAVPGLYSLEGDTLKLCFRSDYKKGGKLAEPPQRPTELSAGKGSEQVLMVLRREKP